jgi:preprotein translocase subunit SecD
MKNLMLIAALLGSVSVAQNVPLANGIYAIEEGNANGKNLVIRQLEGKSVVLDAANFVPFVIEGKPEINRGPQGTGLGLQLAPDAAKRLEDLTRSHMNRRIAVVVSDRIFSAPTVRSVITDGKARLTPCQDESCRTLLQQLSK